jgi:AcrR family transcriptional regulator
MKENKITTKDKIKNAAIELFNNSDTISITTNHISKHVGISTGNLYYHYKNKEEIIREIYIDVSNIFESYNFFETILISDNPIKELVKMHDTYIELFLKYKFIIRDSAVLMALDPLLKDMYANKQNKRIIQFEGILKYLISQGILVGISNNEIPIRAKLHWFISAYWQVFSATTGMVTKESIIETKEIIFKIHIYPFLSKKGKDMLSGIN